MTPHAKVYLKHFNLTEADFVSCEKCGMHAIDIHHVNGRGNGKNVIKNLMALCRECHTWVHANKRAEVQVIHDKYLKNGKADY